MFDCCHDCPTVLCSTNRRVENARLKVGMVEKDKELRETVDSLQVGAVCSSSLFRLTKQPSLPCAVSSSGLISRHHPAVLPQPSLARIPVCVMTAQLFIYPLNTYPQARVQRLASELHATTVRAELLSAKGGMYDQLHAQAEQQRQENQRLQVCAGARV